MRKHAFEVKKQIADNAEKRLQNKKITSIENQQMKEVKQDEKSILQHIKQAKISELQSLNIPEKYVVELENKKL